MTDLPVLHLTPCRVGLDGYTPEDRFRDFRAVFAGADASTEIQKSRVLFQILDECGHMRPQLDDPENVNRTFKQLGKWEVAQTLLTWITSEPAPMPDVEQQNGDPRENV